MLALIELYPRTSRLISYIGSSSLSRAKKNEQAYFPDILNTFIKKVSMKSFWTPSSRRGLDIEIRPPVDYIQQPVITELHISGDLQLAGVYEKGTWISYTRDVKMPIVPRSLVPTLILYNAGQKKLIS